MDYERAVVGTAIFIESEMALFRECMQQYARKLLHTADIVREAMLQQSEWQTPVGPQNMQRASRARLAPMGLMKRIVRAVRGYRFGGFVPGAGRSRG
jgi:hypothetical protein